MSDLALDVGVEVYLSSVFLLDSSLRSPSETGAQSDSASALTRGANDSIACLFAFVRWENVSVVGYW